jgi:hypothetical protein
MENYIGRKLIGEVIPIDDVCPLRKPCSKWMTQCPYRLSREWIVVARNQEYRRMRGTTLPEGPCKPFPKIGLGFWIVEQVSGAQQSMHRVTPRHVEDVGDHVHACP